MVKNGAKNYKPDFTTQQTIFMDAGNQKTAAFYDNKKGRSTYDETSLGRRVTIDWDKNRCYNDPDMSKSNLNDVIAQLNDPTYNVYQGIVDLDIEGKGSSKYHLFKRGTIGGTGTYDEYFTVDSMELRYTLFVLSGPVFVYAWTYFLPGFGYQQKSFSASDWSKYNHCPAFSSLFLE